MLYVANLEMANDDITHLAIGLSLALQIRNDESLQPDESVDQTNQNTNQTTNKPTKNQTINKPTKKPTNQPTNQQTNQQTYSFSPHPHLVPFIASSSLISPFPFHLKPLSKTNHISCTCTITQYPFQPIHFSNQSIHSSNHPSI